MDFRLLGPLKVAERDRSLALGGVRQRSRLAVLLLRANEVVSTDRLIDELWGSAQPATAAKSFRVHVSTLREEFEGRLVIPSPGHDLRFDPSELDLARLERLVRRGESGRPRHADGVRAQGPRPVGLAPAEARTRFGWSLSGAHS
jgi:DNA-binding SARP family transcriptional activator